MTETKCYFCKGKAESSPKTGNSLGFDGYTVHCEICGHYNISDEEKFYLETSGFPMVKFVNCIAENIAIHKDEKIPTWISKHQELSGNVGKMVRRNIDEIINQPILHSDKPLSFLKLAASKLIKNTPFDTVVFNLQDFYSLKISEEHEAYEWMKYLKQEGYISSYQVGTDKLNSTTLYLTFKAWQLIEESYRNIHTNQAFIAMSFSEDLSEVEESIKKACKRAGWDAITVKDGDKQYIGLVNDEIIARINQSGFVVADFTDNKRGVYFEAGYASGRGIPVLYTVKKDHMEGEETAGKKLHFDTRNILYIDWKDAADLEKRLFDKIEAVINNKKEKRWISL